VYDCFPPKIFTQVLSCWFCSAGKPSVSQMARIAPASLKRGFVGKKREMVQLGSLKTDYLSVRPQTLHIHASQKTLTKKKASCDERSS